MCSLFLYQLLILVILMCQENTAMDEFSDQSTKCYIQTAAKKIVESSGLCKRPTYDKYGCFAPSEYRMAFQNETMTNIVEKKDPFDPQNTLLDLSLTISASGSVLFVIHGVTHAEHSRTRCVTICYPNVTVARGESLTLHLEHLKLPHGIYNFTGAWVGRTDGGISTRSIPSSSKWSKISQVEDGARKEPCFKEKAKTEILAHRNFEVGKETWNGNRNGNSDWKETWTYNESEAKHLVKREPSCIKCWHEYYEDHGLLRFFCNKSDPSCANFTVRLLKYTKELDGEEACLEIEKSAALEHMTQIGKTRFPDEFPVDFANTPTGCYLIRTLQGTFHGLIWLEAANTTLMDAWNTTILINPRNSDSSVDVSWAAPPFPYNFTSWRLTLWYLRNETVACEGKNSENQLAGSVEIVLNTTSNTFYNLSLGFYCVRIFPVDYRCASDGCMPLSSKTVELVGPPKPKETEETGFSLLMFVLVIVCVVVAVSISILLYILYRRRFFKLRTTYTPVSIEMYHLEPLHVLVIWSRVFGETSSQFEDVVKCFKELLRSYSNCTKVYDYLDVSSMDRREREFLLTDPTQWLQSHLQYGNEKVILIGSLGAGPREELTLNGIPGKGRNLTPNGFHIEGEAPSNPAPVVIDSAREGCPEKALVENGCTSEKTHSEGAPAPNGVHMQDSIDRLLYPCVLRYLRESQNLSSDYSRIFYVWFPGLDTPEADLNVVPSSRYEIPNHLRILTLKLRGLPEDASLGPPPPKQTSHLQNLINICKNK